MQVNVVDNPTHLDGLRVVNDIEETVKSLENGEMVCRFEFGDSMKPILVSGQYARLTPIKGETPNVGDVVLNSIGGQWNTHMVWNVNKASGFCLIGDSKGNYFAWTKKILAIATPMPYIQNEN